MKASLVALLLALLLALLSHLAPAFAETPKSTDAPPVVQQEFDGFIKKFRTALKADDSAAVASMTQLPFMADASISDASAFRAKIYSGDFTARNRKCIQRGKAVYARDGANKDSYFIFCGDLIFTFTRTAQGFLLSEIGMND
ncbi:hypothetical protein Nwi_1634 [Nitrobacter winogradskyi Nb-255]|uniref:DUF4440 domain-containing protein n=1 Tax=Nitrobacter winogradskyi (strain ATCC 25391 / DSM 10237 / CIP 104748 / NCIMB 11846 / Nb-255) TaxID=323098 RepID=Q3SS46_NITWN|nr:hypothetical protein [Nitrobacter winogradskyi]ABA04895.1 hypothetical protein Nwi_1634 [Nitrobacter winogradskyi Nb-255]